MIDAVGRNGISALQQTLRTQGTKGALVVRPGQLAQLRNVSPLVGEKSSDFTRNLHRNLAEFIGQRFGITVTDILCDPQGKGSLISAKPTFMEKLRTSNGNLEVLGHTVIFEMESDDSGKVYFLKNPDNISIAQKTIEPPQPLSSAMWELLKPYKANPTSPILEKPDRKENASLAIVVDIFGVAQDRFSIFDNVSVFEGFRTDESRVLQDVDLWDRYGIKFLSSRKNFFVIDVRFSVDTSKIKSVNFIGEGELFGKGTLSVYDRSTLPYVPSYCLRIKKPFKFSELFRSSPGQSDQDVKLIGYLEIRYQSGETRRMDLFIRKRRPSSLGENSKK